MKKLFDLTGKKALITGATGGLGYSIAQTFHQQGATLIITGTRRDVLKKITTDLGEDCHSVTCHLNHPEEVDTLISQAETTYGPIDILVNNAGITRDNLVLRMKDEEFQEVLSVNLEAPFKLMRACLKGMIKRRWGRIINITSIVGVTGNPGQANYCASKAGLIGASKAVAGEVASRGVTVNCIAPGFIASPMTEALSEPHKGKLLAAIPQGRMGSGADIAYAAVFLASEEASYMTGQTLHVNGGMAMI